VKEEALDRTLWRTGLEKDLSQERKSNGWNKPVKQRYPARTGESWGVLCWSYS